MSFDLYKMLLLIKQSHQAENNNREQHTLVQWSTEAALCTLQAQGKASSITLQQRLVKQLPTVLNIISQLNQQAENNAVCELLLAEVSEFYHWLTRQPEGLADDDILKNWQDWQEPAKPSQIINFSGFLNWNTVLNQTVAFADKNSYQTPIPNTEFINDWANDMHQLFIIAEQMQILPICTNKNLLQRAASLYHRVTTGIIDLFMVCPDPDVARGWFDYQKEYKARLLQQENLQQLLQWRELFYQALLILAPPLPIPFPPLKKTDDDAELPMKAATENTQSHLPAMKF